VRSAQDVLGALNDVHMAHLMLDGLSGEAGVERAIGYVLGWHQCRADAIWARKCADVSLHM